MRSQAEIIQKMEEQDAKCKNLNGKFREIKNENLRDKLRQKKAYALGSSNGLAWMLEHNKEEARELIKLKDEETRKLNGQILSDQNEVFKESKRVQKKYNVGIVEAIRWAYNHRIDND